MDKKMLSPVAQQQALMSAQIYTHDKVYVDNDWRCSARIPQDVALSIYRNNLHGGVAQHLQTHFPVAHAYIGQQAYRAICAEYLKQSPPEQPIFTVYAAHFPGFLMEYGEQNPKQLIWAVAARLMQIDFFHHNAFCENQRIEVDDQYYRLWINIKESMGTVTPVDSGGLYQNVDLHPERYPQTKGQAITLVTFWHDEELYFRVE